MCGAFAVGRGPVALCCRASGRDMTCRGWGLNGAVVHHRPLALWGATAGCALCFLPRRLSAILLHTYLMLLPLVVGLWYGAMALAAVIWCAVDWGG